MANIDLLYADSTFLRLVPCTETDGKITGLGTKMDFLSIVSVKPTFMSPNASTSEAYFTSEGANNNRYSTLDKSKNYNIRTGDVIADDSSGDASERFECEVFLTATQRKSIIDLFTAGTPVFAISDIGKKTLDEAPAGFEYVLGKITDLQDSRERSASKLSFSVTASKAIEINLTAEVPDIDETDLNAVATGAGNTITPVNESAKTVTALTSGDWTNLVAGKIVIKNAS
ncbi:MAG: hypothetical protein KIT33_09820 [Candidatus Kapabacteria bacterium]|nr:hypothetical protein [Ignavibacteriota bacterium]MCW5885254.1 hypothetical protein [Candidatus Kapabacteria bacterium]